MAAGTYDFADHLVRAKFVTQLHATVDAACKEHFAEEPRKHLGASVLGDDCKAKSWNTFRWLKQEDFSGTMYRLFNRGHLEEPRLVSWLRMAGFEVWEVDPATGKQFRVMGVMGHFGGSLDGVASREDTGPLLAEFKTHNEKSFTKLAGKKASFGAPRTGGDGVAKSKPMHYRQMCAYGKVYGFKYAIYCAVNKDTDELYFEVVYLDWNMSDELYRKAEAIVRARQQPQKIAQVETYFDCKMCHYAGICHRGEAPEKNCRSCYHAVPTEGGSWTCELYNAIIPDDVIPKGCDNWHRVI